MYSGFCYNDLNRRRSTLFGGLNEFTKLRDNTGFKSDRFENIAITKRAVF